MMFYFYSLASADGAVLCDCKDKCFFAIDTWCKKIARELTMLGWGGISEKTVVFMACFHRFWVFFFDFGLEHFGVRVRCKSAVSPIEVRCEGVEVWRLCVGSCSYLTHWVSLCQSTLFCLAKTVQKYDRGIAVYEWKRNFFSFFLQNTNCHLISHYTFRCGTVHCPKSTPNQCLFLILTNGLMFCLWSGCPVFLLVILTFFLTSLTAFLKRLTTVYYYNCKDTEIITSSRAQASLRGRKAIGLGNRGLWCCRRVLWSRGRNGARMGRTAVRPPFSFSFCNRGPWKRRQSWVNARNSAEHLVLSTLWFRDGYHQCFLREGCGKVSAV